MSAALMLFIFLFSGGAWAQTTDPALAPPSNQMNDRHVPYTPGPMPPNAPNMPPPTKINPVPKPGQASVTPASPNKNPNMSRPTAAPNPFPGVKPNVNANPNPNPNHVPNPGVNLPPSQIYPQGDGAPAASPAPAAKVEDGRGILQGIVEDYKYEPMGKRDPFAYYNAPKMNADCSPFEDCDNDLQRFDLDQLKLVGIIWDVKNPKAMFVDPSQKTHVVGEQDKVGRNNGYIAKIREGEIVIVEKFYNLGRYTYQTRILKLQRE